MDQNVVVAAAFALLVFAAVVTLFWDRSPDEAAPDPAPGPNTTTN